MTRLTEPPGWLYEEDPTRVPPGINMLFVFRSNQNWCGVDHLIRGRMDCLAALLSREFGGKFVQLRHYLRPMPPDVDTMSTLMPLEYNYLMIYDKGEKVREIEAYSEEENPRIDTGRRFPFEKPFAHAPGALKNWSPGKNYIEIDEAAYEMYDVFTEDGLIDFCDRLGFVYMDAQDDENVILLDEHFEA